MIKLFSEIGKHERDLIGGKAYSQALLWKQGFNVPPGLIVTTEAFQAFLHAQSLSDAPAEFDRDPSKVEQLRARIENAQLPNDLLKEIDQKFSTLFKETNYHRFAVRSSALGEDSEAHSFAGIHRTLLGVTREELPEAILACWASAFGPQAVGYRREHSLSFAGLRIAVLIQPLIIPVCSGVAFTIDPITGNRDEMIVNATYGLGEMLVSGQVEPDLYRLRKGEPPLIVERSKGAKAEQMILRDSRLERVSVDDSLREQLALDEDQMIGLGSELQRIEAAFGAPQDVEWAHDGRSLFILQSRPITTARPVELELEWSRVNFREIVPELPSAFCSGMMKMSEPDFARHYKASGLDIEHLRPVLKIIYGRPYFNLSIFKSTAEATGMPIELMLRMFGHGEEFKGVVDYRINFRKLLGNLPTVLRTVIRQIRFIPTVEWFVAATEQELAILSKLDIDRMSYLEYLTTLEERRSYFNNFLFNAMSIGSAIMGKLITILGLVKDVMASPENFINTQIAVGVKNVSTQQGLDLLSLGKTARAEPRCREYFTLERDRFNDYQTALAGTEFLDRFQEFLSCYGHRGIYETDIAQPRYREDPEYLLFAVRNMVNTINFRTPEEICAQQEEQAATQWQTLEEKLHRSTIFAPLKLEIIQWQLRTLKELFSLRERVRSEGVRFMSASRDFHLRLAARLEREGYINSRDDFFMLEPQELIDAATTGELTALQPIIEKRKAIYAFYKKLDLPNLLREAEIPAIAARTMHTAQTGILRFQGLAVSPGLIEAEVVVIESPSEFARMKPGRILVAPATDPAWTPLFTMAAGVIVEMGGMLSHGSIVAREYGLPTVVNIPGILKRLRDGDRVLVNGTTGEVEVIEERENHKDTKTQRHKEK
jgi:rifampicin phosphotransferase